MRKMGKSIAAVVGVPVLVGAMAADVMAAPDCKALPARHEVRNALNAAGDEVRTLGVGLGNDMWATIVNRDGLVCAVTRTGATRADQWPGSRVISAQKANTANAFSLEGQYPNVAGVGRALSTGNLYGLVQPGGSLFGLQFSNPVDTAVAYGTPGSQGKGGANRYGTANDPLVNQFVGGVNVFGGGLALYNSKGVLVGAVGVSGDTSCTDHIVAWKVRDAVDFDSIPGGVSSGTDNLTLANPPAANSFEHPPCGFGEEGVIAGLPTTNPVE